MVHPKMKNNCSYFVIKTTLQACLIISGMLTYGQDSSKIGTQNQFILSGYAETYYTYDFNKPSDNLRPVFFYNHNRHNEFNINLAFIRGTYAADKARATISIAVGTYMNANYAAEPSTLKNVYEANIGFRLTKKNMWLDMGVLPSHIGFESATGKDCWTLTRSILADNTPFFESGARISYTNDNGKLFVSGMALNGWQRITRVSGSSLMSFGTQIQYRPDSKTTFNYSTFIGTDKPDSSRLNRFYHNLYTILQVSNNVGITAGFDIGSEQQSKGNRKHNIVYSPVLISKYTINNKWAMAARAEYYNDKNGVLITTRSPHGFQTIGYSINLDYSPNSNMLIRVEGRSLHSKDDIFVRGSSMISNDSFITSSFAVSF